MFKRIESRRVLRIESLEDRAMLSASPAPVISDFRAIHPIGDFWTFTGKVTDRDDPVAGLKVQFGGVLTKYNLTATVGKNGGFSITKDLPSLTTGTATAQTSDTHGRLSNVAYALVVVTQPFRAISRFSVGNFSASGASSSNTITSSSSSAVTAQASSSKVSTDCTLAAATQKNDAVSSSQGSNSTKAKTVMSQVQVLPGRLSPLAIDHVIGCRLRF